jgi:hypothetical protein
MDEEDGGRTPCKFRPRPHAPLLSHARAIAAATADATSSSSPVLRVSLVTRRRKNSFARRVRAAPLPAVQRVVVADSSGNRRAALAPESDPPWLVDGESKRGVIVVVVVFATRLLCFSMWSSQGSFSGTYHQPVSADDDDVTADATGSGLRAGVRVCGGVVDANVSGVDVACVMYRRDTQVVVCVRESLFTWRSRNGVTSPSASSLRKETATTGTAVCLLFGVAGAA